MAQDNQAVWFCATGKTGLGHLRRCAHVAQALRTLRPTLDIGLVTNASPADVERSHGDLFSSVVFAERARMADVLAGRGSGPVVVDTAVVPDIDRLARPLILILRETPEDRQAGFSLAARRWDLVLVPNPQSHWMPRLAPAFATRIEAVGWIYRTAQIVVRDAREEPRLLVAMGGGGSADTAAGFRTSIDPLIGAARAHCQRRFTVVQALAPRASREHRLSTSDSVLDPAGNLDQQFAAADAVISTAGYNSVLELARLDVPTLLVPIRRRFDDQTARARLWGPKLGRWYDGNIAALSPWLADTLGHRRRRPPVDLGPSGETQAARLILDLFE